MDNSLLSVVGSIATVALIAVAIRWLTGAKGSPLPKARSGASVYEIKWQWRVFGIIVAVFSAVLLIWSWHDLHHFEMILVILSMTFATSGIWLASGSVRTNHSGITKTVLWHSRSFQWKDITEIRLHKKQGGAIELRSGAQKLVIDSRFNAFQHLLNEIKDYTQLHPI